MEPEKGSQLQDTQRKTAGAPGKRAEQSHQKRLRKSLPHPQQEERMKTRLCLHRKKNPHIYIWTTSRVQPQGPDPHTHISEPPNTPASAYRLLPNLKSIDTNLVVSVAEKHLRRWRNVRLKHEGAPDRTSKQHPDHQGWWPAAKTHKASHRRRERRGEKTDIAKKATPKV